MIEAIANCSDRTIKISGPVASGKTEALVMRCANLLDAGVQPDKIQVVCATSFACQAFRGRLEKAVGENRELAQQVNVSTALDLCISTLQKPEIQAITGRSGRLITKFEYNFILEDMKTFGQPRRELRRMFKHFYTNWANFTSESEWRYGDGEVVCNYLTGFARMLGGVIKEEAPYLCAKALQSVEGSQYAASFDYVLCDDYQNLSRAEQIVVCLHADTQLIVAGSVNERGRTGSAYPNPDGFAKFDALRHGVTVFTLDTTFGNAKVQRMANALLDADPERDDCIASGYSDIEENIDLIKWNTPKDELVGLTKVLRSDSNQDRDRRERDICIVVPNKRWARMYEKALLQRGFKVSSAGAINGIGGDPRDASTCPALVAYIKLNIIAHSDDAMAWRAWCGLNDYLTNSQSWQGLYAMVDEDNSVLDCLNKIAASLENGEKEPFLRANVLAERYVAGKEFVTANRGRRGFNLLEAVGAAGLPEYSFVEEAIEGDESAENLFELVKTHVSNPVFPEGLHIIRISSYENMPGTTYETIIAPALVDGYMPNRNAFEVVSTDKQRKEVMKEERRLFYGTLGKASQTLILSYFSKCDLELAERTKMQVARIRSENGERIALARPCCFLAEAGQEVPGSISGQTYLAERGLN